MSPFLNSVGTIVFSIHAAVLVLGVLILVSALLFVKTDDFAQAATTIMSLLAVGGVSLGTLALLFLPAMVGAALISQSRLCWHCENCGSYFDKMME